MLLASLETMLNRNIAASGAARAACRRIAGKTLAVRILATPQSTMFSVYCTGDGERVSFATTSDATPAATLSGTPLAYLSMVRATPEATLRAGAVRIEGDADAAQAFRDVLQAARPDVEEELSRLIGDVGAHQVANLARGAFTFGKRVSDTLAQNVAEYLQEETRDLVARIEVDEFIDAVERLRDGVERAEARIKQLQARA